VLSVADVHLSFGGLKALQGVSFDAAAGEITGIIGPNGAGKTSLFNVISGFYKPNHGRILFQEKDVSHLKPDARAHAGMSRTFQNIALFRGMTVLDNIKLGCHTHLRANVWSSLMYFGSAQKEELQARKEIEEEVIDFLEIDHIRKAPITALSYGLQKRVELARALAMRPKLLMLDEPVAGMNREETADMARFILDAQARFGTTILLVEHDMHLVMDICAKVVVLNFGRQIADGSPKDIAHNQNVIDAYLGQAG
jgi:branched-chain amino acid transport system ATP-binding protein